MTSADAIVHIEGIRDVMMAHKKQGIEWIGVHADVEPVFDRHRGINTVDFHIALCQLVNQDLKLPFSFYISPAKLGNIFNGMATCSPD